MTALLLLSACSGERYTALMRAAQNGDDEAVNRMLDLGANINERTSKGKTALMLASAEGHDSTVKILLQRGADVFLTDNYNTTALIVAATNNKADAVRTLLKHKADPAHKDSSGGSAISNASFFGHTEVITSILTYTQKKLPIKDLEESLLLTAGLGHYDIAKALLDYGVNINARGVKQRTPLMAAIHFERNKVVKLLMDRGADLKAEDEDGQSAVSLARQSNDEIKDIVGRTGKKTASNDKPRSESRLSDSKPIQPPSNKPRQQNPSKPAPVPGTVSSSTGNNNKIPVVPVKQGITTPAGKATPAPVKVIPRDTAGKPVVVETIGGTGNTAPSTSKTNTTTPPTQGKPVAITPINPTPISPPPTAEPLPEHQPETISPDLVTGPE